MNNNIARNTDSLIKRIDNNKSVVKFDFNKWIFSQFSVPQNGNILELCCGTGAQTKYLTRLSGNNSIVYILDASEDALNIATKICENIGSKIMPIHGQLDDISVLIPQNIDFSLIFCSYGLYYSKNIKKLFHTLKNILSKDGLLVIVGPYNKNNGELFSLLRRNDVLIEKSVLSSSCTFMTRTILPYMISNFRNIVVNMAENPIGWKSVKEVISYWENTTFYDSSKRNKIENELTTFFNTENVFINTKHIMCAIASNKQ